MDPHFLNIPWHEVLLPKPSWAEKLVRPLLVYGVLLVLFRLISRRELAQATLFDLLNLLLISNVVQNAMIGDDNSILGASGGAVVLLVLGSTLDRIAAGNRRVRRILEGKPVLLAEDGVIHEALMHRHSVPCSDLLTSMRKAGVVRVADVRYAIMELDGTITVIPADRDPRPIDCLPDDLVRPA